MKCFGSKATDEKLDSESGLQRQMSMEFIYSRHNISTFSSTDIVYIVKN